MKRAGYHFFRMRYKGLKKGNMEFLLNATAFNLRVHVTAGRAETLVARLMLAIEPYPSKPLADFKT